MAEIKRHRLLERLWFYPTDGKGGFALECGHRIDYDQLKASRKRGERNLVYCQHCAAIPHSVTNSKGHA